MKRSIVIILIMIFSPLFAWEMTYGGSKSDRANTMIETSDGSYVIAGITNSFASPLGWDTQEYSDAYLLKVDDEGSVIWSRFYGGQESDDVTCIVEIEDGSLYCGGNTCSFGSGESDVWLFKLSKVGNLEWSQTYGYRGSDYCHNIIRTDDNCLIIIGATSSFSSSHYEDLYIIKTDLDGNEIWSKRYGAPDYLERAIAGIQLKNGDLVILTVFWEVGYDFEKAKLYILDGRGDVIFTETLDYESDMWGSCIKNTFDGGYILAGSRKNGESMEGWLIKKDKHHNDLWTKVLSVKGKPNLITNIAQTSDSAYIVIGSIGGYLSGWSDVSMSKLDKLGNGMWSRFYGGPDFDYGVSILECKDNSYLLLCDTKSWGFSEYDIWLIKTDSY